MSNIAFVGLGSMGAPLARLIAAGGVDLAVYDPFADALKAFDGIARLAASPADVARGVDIACICVRDDKQVRDVLFGTDGMVETLPAGALVLVHSTISVAAVHNLKKMLAARDLTLVDAPVSRTRRTDDERFVFTMLGGETADVDRARPLVAAFSTDVDHMGSLGAGMATKIANNLVTWIHIIVAVQATDMALGSGVDLDKYLAVMRQNGNLTPTMGAVVSGKFQSVHDDTRQALYDSQGGIGEKDLALALAGAEAAGIDVRLIREAQATVRSVMGKRPRHVADLS